MAASRWRVQAGALHQGAGFREQVAHPALRNAGGVAAAMSALRGQALGFEQVDAGVEVAHYVVGFSSETQQKFRILS